MALVLTILPRRDVLHASTTAIPAPNLQLIAKGGEGSDQEICRLAGIVLALVVQVSLGVIPAQPLRGLGLNFTFLAASRIIGSSMSSGYRVSTSGFSVRLCGALSRSVQTLFPTSVVHPFNALRLSQVMSKVGTKSDRDKEAAVEAEYAFRVPSVELFLTLVTCQRRLGVLRPSTRAIATSQ